jgi:hypothetical protein
MNRVKLLVSIIDKIQCIFQKRRAIYLNLDLYSSILASLRALCSLSCHFSSIDYCVNLIRLCLACSCYILLVSTNENTCCKRNIAKTFLIFKIGVYSLNISERWLGTVGVCDLNSVYGFLVRLTCSVKLVKPITGAQLLLCSSYVSG